MKMICHALAISVALTASLQSQAAETGAALTPSYVLKHADELNGHTVIVRGTVEIGPERRCMHDDVAFLTLHNTALTPRRAGKWKGAMTLRAVFKKRLNGPDQIDLAECGPSGLEIVSVISDG